MHTGLHTPHNVGERLIGANLRLNARKQIELMTPESRQWHNQLHARLTAVCRGCNVAEIARHTGTNPETTRRYMRGITPPTAEFLSVLCQVSGVSAQWLLCGEGEPNGSLLQAIHQSRLRFTRE